MWYCKTSIVWNGFRKGAFLVHVYILIYQNLEYLKSDIKVSLGNGILHYGFT